MLEKVGMTRAGGGVRDRGRLYSSRVGQKVWCAAVIKKPPPLWKRGGRRAMPLKLKIDSVDALAFCQYLDRYGMVVTLRVTAVSPSRVKS